jgi:hypothetical protein
MCFNGPAGMRISAFLTSTPCLPSASAMSALVTEPNRRPVHAGFLRDVDLHALELAPRSCAEVSCSLAFFSRSARRSSNSLQVLRRGALGLAVRDEEVAGVAVLHLHHVAQAAQVHHLFHQDHLHGGFLSAGR